MKEYHLTLRNGEIIIGTIESTDSGLSIMSDGKEIFKVHSHDTDILESALLDDDLIKTVEIKLV